MFYFLYTLLVPEIVSGTPDLHWDLDHFELTSEFLTLKCTGVSWQKTFLLGREGLRLSYPECTNVCAGVVEQLILAVQSWVKLLHVLIHVLSNFHIHSLKSHNLYWRNETSYVAAYLFLLASFFSDAL